MSNLEDMVEAVSQELSLIADILEKIVYRIEVLEEDTSDMARTLYNLEEKANRYFNEQGPKRYIVNNAHLHIDDTWTSNSLSDEGVDKIKKWINDETDNS